MGNRHTKESVLRKIRKTKNCWIWTGTIDPNNNYGKVTYHGKAKMAHRLIYELLVGEIPNGLTIDHLCRNHKCVNPTHLEPVTNAENVLRGVGQPAKNRRKTKCLRGHPFNEENTRMHKGWRICRKCHLMRWHKAHPSPPSSLIPPKS